MIVMKTGKTIEEWNREFAFRCNIQGFENMIISNSCIHKGFVILVNNELRIET